ncbi:uncharacterized protein LOC124438412 [Xenia sp. Carnegie-2017]|uniref:uncharacterized protein LOC124438412 n=1 Tax=Xenia sp. Carnegie-2017 TaxID=2897299 RepID=UPI001F043045|nr:uncharacterized protein LOC124438412 [Xenia sp. Carnegie-2017]
MESLKQVIQMIKPDCFMASLDIRDAYYSVAIHESHQKYLKFHFKGQLYQFTCMPNGLACAPRLFTKLLKPVYGHLRAQGLLSVGYIDDSYLQGYSYDDCRHNVSTTSTFLSELGFCVHEEKSNFIPSQEIEFLGFLLNSKLMIVSLTPNKSRRLKQACEKLMTQTQPSIREVSEVIGILVASFPGVEMGPLFYRQLENDKISALKACRGHYDEVMTPSKTSLADLRWWADNIETTYKTISKPKPEYTLFTDASLLGWGANFQGKSAGGQWLPTEAVQHINYLEMSAVLWVYKPFVLGSTSSVTEITTDGLQFIRQSIESTGISPEATEILMCSWRKSTRQQYKGYLERWTRFCLKNGFQPCAPQINEIIADCKWLLTPTQGYNDIRQALNIEVVIAGAISCNPFVPRNGSVESQSNFTYRLTAI